MSTRQESDHASPGAVASIPAKPAGRAWIRTRLREARERLAGYVELHDLVRAVADLLDVTDALAEEAGLQPAAAGLEGRCSMRLSYSPVKDNSIKPQELRLFEGRSAVLSGAYDASAGRNEPLGLLERDAKGRLSFLSDAGILTEIPLIAEEIPSTSSGGVKCIHCRAVIRRVAVHLPWYHVNTKLDWLNGGHKAEPEEFHEQLPPTGHERAE